MPRLQLTPLARYPYRTTITVRTTDLNYGGHLGNDRLLAFVQEARVAFLGAHDWTELDCGGVSLIMSDAALVFLKEAFAGDNLFVEVGAGEPSRVGFRLFYRFTNAADEESVALAETGMVCFDYSDRSIAVLPDAVRAVCTAR